MRVRELTIENFRKFRRPVRLASFNDGLNLVCEANETGKSTVLEALRAVLFERPGSKSDRIQSFRPHGDDVAPTVELTFEVGAAPWKVRKRFLQKSEIVLEGPDGRTTGDQAEEKLQALLGFSRAGNRGADADSRGALGLLWVEQGRSFVLDAPGQAARRTLESVLASEVGAVTGGRRVAAVMEAVQKSLSDLATGTGRPARRLLAAQQAAEAAAAAAASNTADSELVQFEAVLDRLEVKRNELRRLLRDLNDPELAGQLSVLDDDIKKARAAGQALNLAKVSLRDATRTREGLETRISERARLREALRTVEGERSSATMAAAEHRENLEAAREAERGAVTALESARRVTREADEARKVAQAALSAEERKLILAAAFARLDAAEAIDAALQAAHHILTSATMTDSAAERLQALEQVVVKTRSAASAGAATLQIALEPTAPEVRLNGSRVDGRAGVAITEKYLLEIAGVGSVTIQPPATGEAAQAALRAAEQDLSDFLAQVGYPSANEARAAARVRAQTEQQIQGLSVRLTSTCPADPALKASAGLEALRQALTKETRPTLDAASSTKQEPSEDPQAAWESALTAERSAEGRRDAAIETMRAAEIEDVRLAGLLATIEANYQRLTQDLDRDVAAASDDSLDTRLSEAKESEARAIVARDEALRASQGLDEASLTRRRQGIVQRRERMRDDRLELVQETAKLEERAKTLGGTGPVSRAAAASEAAEAARLRHEALKEEAEVLRLLDQTIKDAQLAASRRYLAPITRRIAPYVARLLPNAGLAFGDDYVPRALVRGGREEAAEDLSKGTQEQLAVLTRVAFADLLIEKGQPASLILDDALVFADDDRFESMLEILADAARRMQVIILSCRTSAYRALDAKRILFE